MPWQPSLRGCVGFLCTALLLLAMSPPGLAQRQPLTAADYRQDSWQGWTVYLQRDLIRLHPWRTRMVLDAVHEQMRRILRAVPAGIAGRLQRVPIWISNDNEVGIAYQDDRAWLAAQHRPKAMYGAVEIENAVDFVEWSRQQPWLLLHELTHARHHREFSWRLPGLTEAYRAALQSGLHRRVPQRHPGGPRKAYALISEREYLAELSEAYFGSNDIFPFDRTQLRHYDPVGYRLVRRFWSAPPAHPGPENHRLVAP